MINLSREICFKLKEARRAAKLSQGEVALEVGCNQSALSMFESGDGTKLNDATVEKLAKKFGVDLKVTTTVAESVRPLLREPQSGFCPNASCPSNRSYFVDGRELRLPNREEADPVGGRFCARCGEVLERACPNCGAPVHAGAICSLCGEPYIVV